MMARRADNREGECELDPTVSVVRWGEGDTEDILLV